ncbi:MAG: Maf family nucleotide pyrophosphatase [Bacteroidales bacterium]
MLPPPFNQFKYILASQSPRRQQLFKGMGFDFEIIVREINEVVPDHISGQQIAMYLSEAKADAFRSEELPLNTILITADTIVWLDGKMLGKPAGYQEARQMLQQLSNNRHEVFTGVTFKSCNNLFTFCDTTEVDFHRLSGAQIDFYINEYQPFDKAGAYGVQEWIGYIGVESIIGSFYNVMGLPTQKLYPELERFLLHEIGLLNNETPDK